MVDRGVEHIDKGLDRQLGIVQEVERQFGGAINEAIIQMQLQNNAHHLRAVISLEDRNTELDHALHKRVRSSQIIHQLGRVRDFVVNKIEPVISFVYGNGFVGKDSDQATEDKKNIMSYRYRILVETSPVRIPLPVVFAHFFTVTTEGIIKQSNLIGKSRTKGMLEVISNSNTIYQSPYPGLVALFMVGYNLEDVLIFSQYNSKLPINQQIDFPKIPNMSYFYDNHTGKTIRHLLSIFDVIIEKESSEVRRRPLRMLTREVEKLIVENIQNLYDDDIKKAIEGAFLNQDLGDGAPRTIKVSSDNFESTSFEFIVPSVVEAKVRLLKSLLWDAYRDDAILLNFNQRTFTEMPVQFGGRIMKIEDIILAYAHAHINETGPANSVVTFFTKVINQINITEDEGL